MSTRTADSLSGPIPSGNLQDAESNGVGTSEATYQHRLISNSGDRRTTRDEHGKAIYWADAAAARGQWGGREERINHPGYRTAPVYPGEGMTPSPIRTTKQYSSPRCPNLDNVKILQSY